MLRWVKDRALTFWMITVPVCKALVTVTIFSLILSIIFPPHTALAQLTAGTSPTGLQDRFGIQMIYPSRIGGQEWFINMNNPTADTNFNPQDKITKNADGSWKMRSEKVRMSVSSREGYHLREITHSGGQREATEKGFLQSTSDWKNVEITGYVKLNSFSEMDNFVWYSRSGVHSDRDPCQGVAYKGNLNYNGDVQFAKEQWHVSYVKTPVKPAIGPVKDKWIGLKFVEYNFNDNASSSSQPLAKMELWLDPDADGLNWIKAYEGADVGQWGRSGTACNVRADEIISWGGPVATFRWDFAPDVDFKYLSVREIEPVGGNIQNIDFFTGTYKGSGIPDFQSVSRDRSTDTTDLETRSATRDRYHNTTFEFNNKTELSLGNDTYVVWSEGDEDNTDVYMKISHDNGTSFGNPINLSNNPASLSYRPQIMANSRDIYVTWEDDDGNSGNTDIFYTKSSDGGRSFAEKQNLSNDPEGSTEPELSLKDNILSVQWKPPIPHVSEVKVRQSDDGGNSFNEVQRINAVMEDSQSGTAPITQPQKAASNNQTKADTRAGDGVRKNIPDSIKTKTTTITKPSTPEEQAFPKADSLKVKTKTNMAIQIKLKVTDIGKAPSLKFSIVAGPLNGKLDNFNAATGTVTYIPNKGFSGNDVFAYKVNNGLKASNIAKIAIQIVPQEQQEPSKHGNVIESEGEEKVKIRKGSTAVEEPQPVTKSDKFQTLKETAKTKNDDKSQDHQPKTELKPSEGKQDITQKTKTDSKTDKPGKQIIGKISSANVTRNSTGNMTSLGGNMTGVGNMTGTANMTGTTGIGNDTGNEPGT
jgi:hypothetical protein